MLIPHLHFGGDCTEAIALYEKAFNTKAMDYDYADNKIAHAEMNIHGQKIFLNDGKEHFVNTFGVNCAAHLILTFNTTEELRACYDKLKEGGRLLAPFEETSYSKLVGNFLDKFGILWGFMVWQ